VHEVRALKKAPIRQLRYASANHVQRHTTCSAAR